MSNNTNTITLKDSVYSASILSLKRDLRAKKELEARLEEKYLVVDEKRKHYDDLVSASKLISAIADKNSIETLDYITGVINKTLGELFKSDTRRIYLKKHMHAGKYAHLKVYLTDAEGTQYDLMLQAGTGLRQVISFLFCLCLIQISGGRKIFIQDELLGGTHGAAKEVLKHIIKIFAKEFQFIMVEYGFDDIGNIYSVEKVGKTSVVYPLNGKEYDPKSVFLFSNNDSFSSAEANSRLEGTEDGDYANSEEE